MTVEDITLVYEYKRVILPRLDTLTRLHDPDAAHTIMDCFLGYGWSLSELLSSSTKVMELLTPYLPPKRPYAGDRPRDPESTNKRRRVDLPGASASIPNHNFSASSSHPPSTHVRHGARDLTDPATMSNLEYALTSSDELTDPAITSILDYAINYPHEFTTLAPLQMTDDESRNV